MKKEVLIIYDADAQYIRAFAEYANQVSGAAFSVAAFTDLEAMLQYMEGKKISILLLAEQLLCAEVLSLDIPILLLADEQSEQNQYEFKEIWKYQSGDKIIREATSYYAMYKIPAEPMRTVCQKTSIYMVYSPVHRCGATSFALTLGQLLGKDRKVLYVNLEEFSGLRSIFQGEYLSDLSDLLYFYLQENTNMDFRLKAAVYSYQSMDYIPPMRYTEDLRNIGMDIWCDFVEKIGGWGDYEVIILDGSNMLQNIMRLFEICNCVFVPYINDEISNKKMQEFRDFLEGSEYGEYIAKIKLFAVPQSERQEFCLEQTCQGSFFNFVKDIARDVIEYE